MVNVSNQGLSSLPKHLTDSDHRPLAELNASRNRLCAFPALPPSFQALISLNLSGASHLFPLSLTAQLSLLNLQKLVCPLLIFSQCH